MRILRLPSCHMPAGTLMLIREAVSGPERFCYVTPGDPGYEQLAAVAEDGSHLLRTDFWPDATAEKICRVLKSLLDKYESQSRPGAVQQARMRPRG